MTTGADRAVSEVVGFILIFSVFVIAFTFYQGVVVPDQNRAAEFTHNTAVQGQLQTLRAAIFSTALTGAGAPTTLSLGASYPERLLASNLATSTGSLSTTTPANLTIHNVSALDPETRDHVGATGSRLGPFPTRSIAYRPTYAFYPDPPTTIVGPEVAVNHFPNGATIPLTDQPVVEGRSLTLVTVTGNLAAAGSSTTTVTATLLSGPATPLAVTNRSGPLTLVLPTRLAADDWRTLLADELDPAGSSPSKYVRSVRPYDSGRVAITLEPGETYRLRLARIGIGDTDGPPAAEYLTAIAGNGTSVTENSTQRLTVEARDRYNNPVSGVPITARVTSGPGRIDGATDRPTTVDGRASFTYHAPPSLDATGRVTVELSFGPSPTERRLVTFSLTAVDPDASAEGPGINPPADLRYRTVTVDGPRSIDVTLENSGDTPIEVTHARLGFIYAPGGNPPSALTTVANASNGTSYHTDPLVPGDPLERLTDGPIPFDPGRHTVRFTFDRSIRDGIFVVTFAHASGSTSTFFIPTG